MSRRLTKDELDEQFEQFLKESVSDDSSVLDSLGKTHSHKPVKKPAATLPWWHDGHDSEEGPARAETAVKRRFTKVKKPQAEDTPQESSPRKSPPQGSLGSGKTFRKSLRRSQSIREEDEGQHGDRGSGDEEDEGQHGDRGSGDEEGMERVVFFSRDSLEPEGLGVDTLEEDEEKARFFAHLEGGASSTIDYSRLNKQMESTTSTTANTLRKAQQQQEDQSRGGVMEPGRTSPASPHYSEDFDDEGSVKESVEEKPVRPTMLARVSLHDSLDSTGQVPPPAEEGDAKREEEEEEEDQRRRKDTMDSLETDEPLPARSYGQSGLSEMEALHEAYRQIGHSDQSQDRPPRQHATPEGRGRSGSPAPPTATPTAAAPASERSGDATLRPASTTESELLTAEELMRPIRPDLDQTRGFTLQPARGVDVPPERPGRSVERGSPGRSSARREGPGVAAGGWREAEKPSPPSPPPSPPPRARSIREEVERLMKDASSPDQITQPSKARKRQAPGRPLVSGSSVSSLRKPSGSPGRGRGAVASRSPGPSRPAGRAGPGAKPPPALVQRRPLAHTSDPTETTQGPDSDLRVSSELVVSVQSFAAYLQHQIHTSGRQDTAAVSRETKGHLAAREKESEPRVEEEERPLVDRQRMQPALQAREEQLLQQQQEITSLRQDNYLLQSKLRSAEENSRKGRWGLEPSETITEEKLSLIEREMKEQETLIQGYHQENEKLYLQLKALQAQSKLNEEAMFTENQRLLNELANAKEQWSKSNTPRIVGNVGVLDHGQRITELLGQIQAAQRSEARLAEENRRLKQEKQALDVDLQVVKRERDQARTQLLHTSGERSSGLRAQEQRHAEEVSALNGRLQWYAENQELLDGDAARLRAAAAETHKLTEQVEKLKTEVGRKRSGQQQSKARERAGDARRILDLERQVKELEEILRRRNPNSLPALIYAAASAGGAQEQGGGARASPPSQTAALLERRVHRLEAELESRDEEAKRSLRAVEQQYQRIKLQYEQQISELEQRLAQAVRPGDPSDSQETRDGRALEEEELAVATETQRARQDALQAEVHALQEQLAQRASPAPPRPGPGAGRGQPSPSRHQRQAEAALGVRVERLTRELAAKTLAVQELGRTVDRLQRERRTMLSGPAPRPADARRQAAAVAVAAPVPKAPAPGEKAETFPPTQDEKDYEPAAFSERPVSELLLESEALRSRLEMLERRGGEERAELQAAATLGQAELRRLQESSAEQLSSLRADHQRALERLVTRHALEHSSSKVAELTNQVTTQEIMLQHLRDQVTELRGTRDSLAGTRDALAVSKVREETLQSQLGRLLEDLKQAKEAHSPELRHFTSLERKIHSMELRHAQREKELRQVIGQTRQAVEAEQQSEVERWRRLAQGRSGELEAFRLELDAILDVLRELQRQGVVLPTLDYPTTVPSSWT